MLRKDKLITTNNMSEVTIQVTSDNVVSLHTISHTADLYESTLSAFTETECKEITDNNE